jgi:type IV pilus assembly protein PilX
MTSRSPATLSGSRRANRGAVLIISLIVLVAMTLGGLAIMRSVDTTVLIAGNLAFKQRTMHAADTGVTTALNWLLTNQSILNNDNNNSNAATSNGYFSSQAFTWTDPLQWANAKFMPEDAAGNQVSYVVHRLCTCPNVAYNGNCAGGGANTCGIDYVGATGSAKPLEGDTFQVGGTVFAATGSLYYRVTVRSRGPRNTESFIQAMLTIPL